MGTQEGQEIFVLHVRCCGGLSEASSRNLPFIRTFTCTQTNIRSSEEKYGQKQNCWMPAGQYLISRGSDGLGGRRSGRYPYARMQG